MRRRQAEKREILPDPKFGDVLATKFMNRIMQDGKRSIAEKIFYGAMEDLEGKLKQPPMEIFHDVLDRVRPDVEVRSRRVGGATYQVPVEVRGERQTALAMRWLVDYARKRGEKTMRDRLVGEIMDAREGRGGAMKKRDETHKMAEANRAFAHYRW